MRSGQDPSGARKFRQVARKYFESEMVALRREVSDTRSESQRLRRALERIQTAEPTSHDVGGLKDLVGSLQSIAREALSHDETPIEVKGDMTGKKGRGHSQLSEGGYNARGIGEPGE